MNGLGNRDIMAKNLRYQLEKSGKTQKELAEVVGVAASTFNEWMQGRKYPRIDKIEMLANYFGILKSDLIEEKSDEHREMQKKNDALADIVVRLRTDDDFLFVVEKLHSLDADKFAGVKQMLQAFVE